MAIKISELLSRPTISNVEDDTSNAPQEGGITAPASVSPKAEKEPSQKVSIKALLQTPTIQADATSTETPEKPIVFAPSAAPAAEFDIGDSLKRGAVTYASMVASGLGFTETGRDWADYAATNLPAHTPDVTKIGLNASDIGSFIGERALENLPNMGATAAGAAAGAAIGSVVPVVGTAAGGLIGGMLASAPSMFGEVRQSIQRETGKDDPLAAVPAATFNTFLETLAPLMIAKKLGVLGPVKKALKETIEENPSLKKLIVETVKGTGSTTFVEGGTEGVQQYTQILTNKVLKDEALLTLSDEQKNELVNAIAGGAAGGGPAGGASVVAGHLINRNTPEGEKALASPEAVLQSMLQDRLRQIQENEDTLARAAADRDVDSPSETNTDLTTMVSGKKPAAQAVPGQQALQEGPKAGTFTVDAFGDLDFDTQDADGNEIAMPIRAEALPAGRVTAAHRKDTSPEDRARMNQIASGLSDMLNKLGLSDMKVLLSDSADVASRIPGYPAKSLGAAGQFADGTFVIGYNPKAMASLRPSNKTADPKVQSELFGLDTAYHELGHAIFSHTWSKASPTEQKALLQGYKDTIQNALKGSYSDKVNAMGMLSEQYMLKDRADLNSVPFRGFLQTQSQKDQTYQTNLAEYLANQFGRYALNRVAQKKYDLPKGMQTVFARAYAKLQSLYRLVKRQTKTHETFEAFLNNMFLRQEVRQIEEAIAAVTPEARKQGQQLKQDLKADGLQQAQDPIANNTPYSKQTGGSYQPIYSASFIGAFLEKLGLKRRADDIRHHEDLAMGFAKISYILTPIQIAELAQKSGFANPAEYMDLVREYANTKMKQVERADTVLHAWKQLGKQSANRVSKLLYEISTASDELGRQLRIDEIDKIVAKVKATPEEVEAWRTIDNSFKDILTDIERGLIYETARSYNKDLAAAKAFREAYLNAADDGERITLVEQFTGEPFINPDTDTLGHPLFTELEQIRTSIRKMQNKNYFPRSRMGEYVVKITSTDKGQSWEGHTSTRSGETLGYYAFDSKKERDAALKEMLSDASDAGLAIVGDKLETEVYSLMSMPQIMIDKISRELDLNDEQRKQLRDISLSLSPGKKFLRHLQKRKGIAGYSEDAMRVYANYMMSAANHLARVEHSRDLIQSLNDIDSFLQEKRTTGLGTVLDDVTRLRDYYRRHFQYLMRPDNDWAGLRAVGFLWYLGFNVKSALVNLTQVPFVTFPVLGARYGDAKASKALLKSYGSVNKWLLGKESLSAQELELIDTLREAGVIDESMVSELAGMGEADVIKRMIPSMDLNGALNKLSYYAGTMFRMGEKYNRLVTALSSYRLMRDSGGTHEDGVKEARWAIETSQYEYTKWNRPELMRGKKSVIFMFWQYLQHSAFLFAGGQGSKTAMRMWIMTALTAGLLGLPFAESLLDLLDASGTFLKKLFGSADPRVDTREWLRELLLEITDQPDKVLYGMSSYWGLGPIHLAGLLGAPIPNVDIQGSISYGKMIPWLEPLAADAQSPNEKLGKMTAAVLGPIAGIPLQMYKAVASDDPNTWKAVEKSLPVFMKNAVQGTRWMVEGQETFKGEGKLMDFSDPEGRVASALKALGFQPTPLTQKYRQIKAVQEATTYYATRRQLLMADFYFAKKTGDREGAADVRSAINDFNKAVKENPDLKKMAITGRDLNQSYRTRTRAVKRREEGQADMRRNRALQNTIQRLYPVEGEE